MKIGTYRERIFKATGVKWLVEKIVIDILGYESCGCDRRRDKLDNLTIKRK